MVEEVELPTHGEIVQQNEPRKGICGCVWAPVYWFRMLAMEMHWSFVYGVVVIYGISQGLGGALNRVGTAYYMKDVQKVQPSAAQVYSGIGITGIPWIVKPIWGILTDVVSIFGYHRKPYFVLAGVMGIISMLYLSLHEKLHLFLALLFLTGGSAGVAIADVTIDACVAQNSGSHPLLAADMQSLCALSSSIGALVGFLLSGILVHLIGPVGVFGLLAIPFGLVLSVGVLLKEPYTTDFTCRQVTQKFTDACKAMWTTLKCPEVWRPCLYMYISLTLSLDIYQGMFYWFTDSEEGPSFSKEAIGYICSIGSVGSLLGAILYQYGLKDYPFRDLCFWTQLLFGLSGMLDLMLVLRLNLKFGIPDSLFVVIDASVSQMILRLKWMPLLVLSSKLCPPGIEGTLFALLMSIDNAGLLTSSWGGGLLLHVLKVTRTEFDELWLAILIRNILRVSPLCLLFLIPGSDPNASILPTEMMLNAEEVSETPEPQNIELAPLVDNVDGRHDDKPQ
ncbi:LOW QUALITY PROTEIN: probable folate-biopterin transporter 2 [Camellia sinensis]|uniref:LOW QUALITY PROTEIN: probable folate-biopterin transporter 2 n=1 Tax=Camellia sinensis TaxID=4442 RepID=UPI001035C782|nr:LOW QUALITY PROTEIN: probable folate-biopterin transporter 2 [Camellia sinensis]